MTPTQENNLLAAIRKSGKCASSGGATGGAGDASAANQVLQTTALNNILAQVTEPKQVFAARLIATPTDIFFVRFDGVNYVRVDTNSPIASNTFEPLETTAGDTYELVPKYYDNNVTDLSNITKIYAQYKTDKDGVITFVRYYAEDAITVFPTPITGTVHDKIGDDTQSNVIFFQLGDVSPNNTYTTNGLTTSVIIDVISIANPALPPTLTTRVDINNPLTQLVKPLREGRVYELETESTIRLVPGMIITANPGDVIDLLVTTKLKI